MTPHADPFELAEDRPVGHGYADVRPIRLLVAGIADAVEEEKRKGQNVM